MSPFRYKKDGFAISLIRVHDVLLKNAIDYYERSKDISRGIKQARKAIKKALRVAQKKKINPGIGIEDARKELEGLQQEIEYTRKAVLVTSASLENALSRIQKERIEEPLSLINHAHELFRNKKIEKGIDLLTNSEQELKKKGLTKSRTVLFGGTSNEVTDLKDKIEEFRRNRRQKKK